MTHLRGGKTATLLFSFFRKTQLNAKAGRQKAVIGGPKAPISCLVHPLSMSADDCCHKRNSMTNSIVLAPFCIQMERYRTYCIDGAIEGQHDTQKVDDEHCAKNEMSESEPRV